VLLPIAQGRLFETELQGKLLLRHVHAVADSPDIDLERSAIGHHRDMAGGQILREGIDALHQRQLDDGLAAVEQTGDDPMSLTQRQMPSSSLSDLADH
jgi:hypothetical protein